MLNKKPLNINMLIQGVVSQYAPQIESRQAVVELKCEEDLPMISGDENSLRSVV